MFGHELKWEKNFFCGYIRMNKTFPTAGFPSPAEHANTERKKPSGKWFFEWGVSSAHKEGSKPKKEAQERKSQPSAPHRPSTERLKNAKKTLSSQKRFRTPQVSTSTTTAPRHQHTQDRTPPVTINGTTEVDDTPDRRRAKMTGPGLANAW